MSSNNPLDLTLIPHQLEMRFPCSTQLKLTLLWKPSLGMMKRGQAGRLGQISLDSSGPFYIELLLDKGLESMIGGLIHSCYNQIRLKEKLRRSLCHDWQQTIKKSDFILAGQHALNAERTFLSTHNPYLNKFSSLNNKTHIFWSDARLMKKKKGSYVFWSAPSW